MTLLTARFEEALVYAAQLHASQTRKGSGVPYISHLLAVAGLVIEDGGDEDQAIAALLHDAVEDQGGLETLDAIRERFGEPVAEIVLACSDTFETPKPPWRARKEAYLAHLPQASPAVLRVSLADKLHNVRDILSGLQRHGALTWTRFKGGRAGTLWYYQTVLDIFRQTNPASPMTAALASALNELVALDATMPAECP